MICTDINKKSNHITVTNLTYHADCYYLLMAMTHKFRKIFPFHHDRTFIKHFLICLTVKVPADIQASCTNFFTVCDLEQKIKGTKSILCLFFYQPCESLRAASRSHFWVTLLPLLCFALVFSVALRSHSRTFCSLWLHAKFV